MLKIQRNTNTVVAVQAHELNTTGEYFWRVKNLDNGGENAFYLVPDEVTNRFAKFTLNLSYVASDYQYWIYDGASPDTDIDNMPVLEIGLMRIDE